MILIFCGNSFMLQEKCVSSSFGFNGFLDLAFEDIWHDVQKGSESILGSTSFQKFTVSPSINDLLDLCPNLKCKNEKEAFFLVYIFFDLDICIFLPKMHVFSVNYVIK